MSDNSCPLCQSAETSLKYIKPNGKTYWDCDLCGLIFLNTSQRPLPSEEKAQYMTHVNDVTDPRYQHFVSPLVNYVLSEFSAESRGLDYGAGPGPVITYLLKNKGYEINLYDPFFWPETSVLDLNYDYIIVCEVIEHFHSPSFEFKKLFKMMKSISSLVIMTDIYYDSVDFDKWYYHGDPTHVVFYRQKTMEWIRHHFGFSELVQINKRAVAFKRASSLP